ncbi:MAG: thioredoxin [Eubacteriales bacterium]|nr:thioredoxin [Eubacteriales bacterium]
MVKKIQNNDMSEVNAQALAVVDFSAVWCGPCKMLAPVVDELAEEMAGEASFYNVDVDDNADVAMKYGIQSVPSIFLFKNGEIVDRTVGFQPKAQLKAWIDAHKA